MVEREDDYGKEESDEEMQAEVFSDSLDSKEERKENKSKTLLNNHYYIGGKEKEEKWHAEEVWDHLEQSPLNDRQWFAPEAQAKDQLSDNARFSLIYLENT